MAYLSTVYFDFSLVLFKCFDVYKGRAQHTI